MLLVCVGRIMHAGRRSVPLHAVMISFISTVFDFFIFSHSLPGLSDFYPNMVDPKCNVVQYTVGISDPVVQKFFSESSGWAFCTVCFY